MKQDPSRGVKVEKSVIVDRSADELYHFWRSFENLPQILQHVESVQPLGGRKSHWVIRGPLGKRFEWDAEIIHEEEGKLIGWQSIEGSDVAHAGSVHFDRAPEGGGTRVRVVLRYEPPAGAVGAAVAKLLGESPEKQIEEDLERFKRLMESAKTRPIGG